MYLCIGAVSLASRHTRQSWSVELRELPSSSSRDPFGMALGILRGQLRGGAYVLGEPLTIVDLARDMGLSPTPVREALSRLAGEGLVQDRRGRGYFAWRLDVADLVELYALNLLHLTGALDADLRATVGSPARRWARDMLDKTLAEAGPVRGLAMFPELLFDRLIAEGSNRALMTSYQTIADRLGPARIAEPDVLDGMADEVAALATFYDADARAELMSALREFHQRRQAQAGRIVNVMRMKHAFS